MKKKEKLEYTTPPDYGSLLTMKDFISHCETGCFIDYDGHGYYATKTKISNRLVHPSDVTGNKERFSMKTGKITRYKTKPTIDKKFEYVRWFNR